MIASSIIAIGRPKSIPFATRRNIVSASVNAWQNEFTTDARTADYARFLASIGINGIVINNVNVKDDNWVKKRKEAELLLN